MHVRADRAMLLLSAAVLTCASNFACDKPGQSGASAAAPAERQLVVLSPHAPAIRDAFAPAFNTWHLNRFGQPVTIRWINKGTIECHHHLLELFAQEPFEIRRGVGIDVFFGGGVAVHRDIVERQYAQPIKLSAEVLSAIPKELNGQPLYAEDGMWHGTALSAVGILVNRAACQMRDIPLPAAWADLAQPPFRYWIAAADPSRSGSSAQCFVLIMLTHGWDEGWGILTGMLANTSGLLPASNLIGPSVSAGIAVAGLEPEFIARMHISENPDALVYVNPPATAAFSPDPITVLTGAPNLQTAERFVEFVLSSEGQRLWALKAEDGGPAGQPLYRHPIRPDVYEQYGDKLLVQGNPFKQPNGVQIDPKVEQAYTNLVPPLVGAMCGRNHLLLQKAWATAMAQGQDSPAMATLKTPLFDKDTAIQLAAKCAESSQAADELENQWSEELRKRYEGIVSQQTARR